MTQLDGPAPFLAGDLVQAGSEPLIVVGPPWLDTPGESAPSYWWPVCPIVNPYNDIDQIVPALVRPACTRSHTPGL